MVPACTMAEAAPALADIARHTPELLDTGVRLLLGLITPEQVALMIVELNSFAATGALTILLKACGGLPI